MVESVIAGHRSSASVRVLVLHEDDAFRSLLSSALLGYAIHATHASPSELPHGVASALVLLDAVRPQLVVIQPTAFAAHGRSLVEALIASSDPSCEWILTPPDAASDDVWRPTDHPVAPTSRPGPLLTEVLATLAA